MSTIDQSIKYNTAKPEISVQTTGFGVNAQYMG